MSLQKHSHSSVSLKMPWNGCCNFTVTDRSTNSIPIQCNGNGDITRIAFSGWDISGNIPGSLATLETLIDLNLMNNDLSGTIPAELAAAPALRTLLLGSNQLSGNIPDGLCYVTQSRDLDLDKQSTHWWNPRITWKLKDN
ncbi:hypothetical protein BC829DRAFT_273414 [Chytridium lagenaria]|nr:hypothetical protein BC829DRAFT_273414 [Chytridium lagenaria]